MTLADAGRSPPALDARDKLRVPDRFTIIGADSGELRLHSLTYSLALRDHEDGFIGRLLALLDGERTVGEVVAALADRDVDDVRAVLAQLLAHEVLERVEPAGDGPPSADELRRLRPQLSFFSHFVVPADVSVSDATPGGARSALEFQLALTRAHVVVIGLGRIGSQLLRALALAGVGRLTAVDASLVGDSDVHCDAWFGQENRGERRCEAAARLVAAVNPEVECVAWPDAGDDLNGLMASVDLAVLCPDGYDPSEFERVNATALATRTPWTSARVVGFELHIGPTVIPFETCCYTCLELRQESNLPDIGEYQIVKAFLREGRLREQMLAFTPGADLLALEVVKALTWFAAPATCSHVYTFDAVTMQSKLRPVLKVPRCPSCGVPARGRPTIHAWQQTSAQPPA